MDEEQLTAVFRIKSRSCTGGKEDVPFGLSD